MRSNLKKSFALHRFTAFALLALLAGCAGGSSNAGDPQEQQIAKLGGQLQNRGDDAGAAAFYQRALQVNPKDDATRVKFADVLEAHGDYLRAGEQYGLLIQNDPDNGDYHRALGRVLIKQGRAADAKGEYEKALAIDSDDVKAMNGLGVALDYLGNHEAAQKTYKDALDERPNDMATLSNLAHSYVLTGAYDEAIALLEPHAQDKNATPALRQNLAEAYGMAGMEADAERVGRMDLSPEQVRHNLSYYRARRAQLSVAPKLYADLGTFPTQAMAEGRIDQVKEIVPVEAEGLVLKATPEVKSIGGLPSFHLQAVGFTRVDKVRIFCDRLKKESIACAAHG